MLSDKQLKKCGVEVDVTKTRFTTYRKTILRLNDHEVRLSGELNSVADVVRAAFEAGVAFGKNSAINHIMAKCSALARQ